MRTEEKKIQIKMLVKDMLNDSFLEQIKTVDKVLNSGAIDIDSWNEEDKPMLIPRAIATAILAAELRQFEARATIYKEVKKIIRNILYFI